MNMEITKIMVAGNLLSVDSKLSPKTLEDISEAVLFCQLYSDTNTRKFDTPAIWYSRHDKALQELKWLGSSCQRHAFEPAASASISVEKLIEQGTPDSPDAAQVEHLKKLLDCMADLTATEEPSLSFRRHTLKVPTEGEPGNATITLQLSVLDETATLSSLFVTFTTTAAVQADAYRQVFPGSTIVGEIDLRFSQHQWSSEGYKDVRAKVRQFLDGKKDGLIQPLSCDCPAGEGDE